MQILKSLVLVILCLLVQFQLTHQYLKKISILKSKNSELFPSSSSTAMSTDDFEDAEVRNELLKNGLRLWNDFFISTEAWDSIKLKYVNINDNIFKICICVLLNTKKNLISIASSNSWFIKYPIIWDVIAKSVKEVPMIDKNEIEEVVDFYLENKKFRQLACMISFQDPPIVCEHFKCTPVDSTPFKTRTLELTSLFEHLFMMNPRRLNQLFDNLGNDNLFLVTSLIACKNQLPNRVRRIITDLIYSDKIDNYLLISHICLGLMFIDCNSDGEAEVVYKRNEALVDYLYSITNPFEPNNIAILIALKACRIVNLVNIYPNSEQNILSLIHMDESAEINKELFAMFSKIIPQKHKRYFVKELESYKTF